jgi:undecaprenyl-phosphate alpha-N-acetylglucosaminyl 1-phosphatetransferase/UDP-N-acetylglucosamine 2-epimerase
MPDPKFVAATAVALTVTLVAIFSLRPLAPRLGLVDRPDGRKHHRGRVPLIGGLCFFLGTLAGLAYLGYLDNFVICLLATGALIFLVGLVDDLDDLSVRSRLGIQACAVGLVMVSTGVYIDSCGQLLGADELRLRALGIPFTFVAVIGLINAFNMLDGIDGLAGGMAMVSIAAIVAFVGDGQSTLSVLLLLQVLFAALIPYLGVNLGWPDGRKIFMGDAGSTLIGFLLAWSLIYLSQRNIALLAPVDVLWCIALPVMDTLAVMIRRVRIGASPFKPDRQHLHHLLLDIGFSQRATLVLILAAGSLLAALGYVLRDVPDLLNALVFAAVFALYVTRLQRVLDRLSGTTGRRSTRALATATPAQAGTDRDYTSLAFEPDLACESALPAAASASGVAIGYQEASAGASIVAPAATVESDGEVDPDRPAMLKALCVLGAPPDAIRMAPVVQQLRRDKRFDARVCVTVVPDAGEDRLLRLFDVQPDLDLDLATSDQDPADVASATLSGMNRVLGEFQPDVVLVQGDTSTALATTLAAYYQQIPVARVEAGLPVAEDDALLHHQQASRAIASTLAAIHFTPTEATGRELLAAGVPPERIAVIGSVAIEAWRTAVEHIERDVALDRELAQRFGFLRAGRPLLLAMQREGGDGLRQVGRALRRIALQRPDIDIVCSQHPDATTTAAHPGWRPPNLHVVELDYLEFAYLLNAAHLVLTDSGNLRDETDWFGKPVLLIGDADTRAQAADGTGREDPCERSLVDEVMRLLGDRDAYEAMRPASRDDDGNEACVQIVEALANLPSRAPSFTA